MTGKSKKETEVAAAEVESLQSKLDEALAKEQEYLDMARRLQADFDNYRKRSKKENDEFKVFATADLIADLLGIVDDLDRALEHADPASDLTIGVRGIRQNMMKVLEGKGLTEIPADGKFDPNCHEALCVVDGDTDGDIAEVFQKGYRMGNRVLRYSKVKVTRGPVQETEQSQEKEADADPEVASDVAQDKVGE